MIFHYYLTGKIKVNKMAVFKARAIIFISIALVLLELHFFHEVGLVQGYSSFLS